MPHNRFLLKLYLLNASLLIGHEIDAAYWQEWELFGLPGGIQLFVLLNLPLVALMLYGLQALAQERASGLGFSWLLVAGGLAAVSLHTYFLWQGHTAFRLPTSVGLLAATGTLSVMQAWALLKRRGPESADGHP